MADAEWPMTDAEWLSCTHPSPMLRHLGRRASGRKLRLFACACCRRIGGTMEDPRSRMAVDVAERFADGLADLQDLQGAHGAAFAAAREIAESRRVRDVTDPDV